ncbi:MAG TPA: hypothetical protein VE934_11980 [Polaromonas sp.]|uniref:hypothetical protein n=1 Tax=Polaromonas sp. TaxID=1869339 RepID=UPI002D545891|nr:hypothetical protein [Polaromonas sp.]HYW57674.1 hypothetical protein [Polaromonas sp.]
MATRKTEAQIVVSGRDTLSPVLARIEARFQAMTRPIQRLQSVMAKPMQLAGVNRLTGSLGRLHGAMERVPFAGSLFAAGGMWMATQSLIQNSAAAHEALGKLEDLSKAYKVSGDALQVYSEIGADSGVALDDVAKSIGFLQQRIAGARRGDKTDLLALANVGINKGDLNKDVTEILNRISEVYKASDKASDEAKKVDFAKQTFGKAGIGIIPMLEDGGSQKYAETLAKMTAEGRLFNANQRAGADRVGDAWAASLRRVDGLRKTVGLAMGPMLEAITESIDKLMTGEARSELIETFKLLGQTIAQEAPKFIAQIPAMVSGLGEIFKTIRSIGSLVGWDKLLLGGLVFIASPFIAATVSMVWALGGVATSLALVIGKLAIMAGSAAMGAIRGIQGIALAMRIMGLSAVASWAMALGPILLVGAVLAGVAFLVYRHWGGIKAFFGGVWQGFTEAMAPVAAAFEPVLNAIKTVLGWVGSLFGATTQSQDGFASWAAAGKTAGQALATVFKVLLAPIMVVLDALKLVAATASMVSGNGFNFTSSTAKLFSQGSNASPAGAALPAAQVAGSRTQFDGKLDVRVLSDGRAQVERVESNNKNMEINARAGAMYKTGSW